MRFAETGRRPRGRPPDTLGQMAPVVQVSKHTPAGETVAHQSHMVDSWPAQAVKTGRIVPPVRIAEVPGSAAERVGLQPRPGGAGEIAACLRQHDEIGWACDIKPEGIGQHAETPSLVCTRGSHRTVGAP